MTLKWGRQNSGTNAEFVMDETKHAFKSSQMSLTSRQNQKVRWIKLLRIKKSRPTFFKMTFAIGKLNLNTMHLSFVLYYYIFIFHILFFAVDFYRIPKVIDAYSRNVGHESHKNSSVITLSW